MLAVLVPENQINAAVCTPTLRVFVPEPNLVDLSRPFRIGVQKPFDEMFELLAPLDRIGIEALIEVGKQSSHFGSVVEVVKALG